jgi:threonine/homoserine/homoserine lactone efflux protein
VIGIESLPLFAATVLAVNATPGVDLLLTIERSLRQGVRGGLAAAAGIVTGCAVHTLAAAFGLAALLLASAEAFTVLRWAGALYLLWLALHLLHDATRGRAQAPAEDGMPAPSPSPRPGRAELARTFRKGLLTNLLNPKIALFFLALLPQFIASDAPEKTVAFLVLGGVFVVQGFLFLALVAWLVAPLARKPVSDRWRRGAQAAGGLLFAGLAVRLAMVSR